MSVYVDPLFQTPTYRKSANERWGWKQACHMTADTEEELHAMARRLGLKREWFQGHHPNPRHWHYDLAASKRILAIRYGAREITLQQMTDRLKGIDIDAVETKQATLF